MVKNNWSLTWCEKTEEESTSHMFLGNWQNEDLDSSKICTSKGQEKNWKFCAKIAFLGV